jgi:hypothetical protein
LVVGLDAKNVSCYNMFIQKAANLDRYLDRAGG